MKQILIVFCCLVSIAACASAPKKTPEQLTHENKALVLGIERRESREVLAFLISAPLQLPPYGEFTHLNFIGINGESCGMWGWKDCRAHSVELPPGHHTLDFQCAGHIGAAKFSHTVPGYHITVEPGHIYQMYADASEDTCRLVHQDITPGIARERFLYALDLLYWKNVDTFKYFGGYLMNFLPKSESRDNWSKRITIQFIMSAQQTALELVNGHQAHLDQICPGAKFTTVELGEDSFTYVFYTPACMNEDEYVGVERIYTGKEGLYKFSYQEKTPGLYDETIQACLELFDKARIKTENPPEE